MRLKIQRFLPFSILSLMALAQPASAQTPAIAQRMNTLLLGLFGLTGSNFATQAGDAAWIFVLCGFLIIFGIVFAVSNYLPFFKDQSNRGARIAFSTGLGIASLVTPGYLDFLWDIGFITFIIALIAILSLCYFIFRGIISGHRAAGANDAETQARADQANAQANQAREGAQTLTREQHEAREAINRAQRVADEHTTLEVGNQTRAEAAAVGTHNLAITQQRTQQVNANRTREAAEEMQVRRGQAVTEFNRLMGIGVDLTRDATGSLRTLQDRLQTIQTSLRAVEGGGLPEDQRVNLLRDIGAAAGVARDMTKVVLAENAALQQIHDIEDHLRHLLGD
ncbi:MAG TPA: hypothetical protein VJG90_08750, partial [Candidatus Nanoarchaeia archaeon]|nr:hypothetical protein [Candidatus Nanoarchaeia archaeon]